MGGEKKARLGGAKGKSGAGIKGGGGGGKQIIGFWQFSHLRIDKGVKKNPLSSTNKRNTKPKNQTKTKEQNKEEQKI